MARATTNGKARRGRRPATERRCTVCRKRKDNVHRSRATGKLVCGSCSDRARMRVGACDGCGERKLIQARNRCYACYKRQWRSARTPGDPSGYRERARAGAAR